MTGKELEKSIKDIWTLFRETDRRLDQRFKETDQRFRETDQRLDQRFNETDKQLKELSKQIGGLGNKFGGFTEGMAYPSMKRILQERFKMEYVSPRVEVHKNGETIELDVLAYSNEEIKTVFIVEVKSRLKEEHLKEILRDLERFPRFFPEHKDKALYGIIAAVDVSEQMKKKVLRSGLYLAIIRDDMFQLDVPADFKPKRFN